MLRTLSGIDRAARAACTLVAATLVTAVATGPAEAGGLAVDDAAPAPGIADERPAPEMQSTRRRTASERVRDNLPNILLYTQDNEHRSASTTTSSKTGSS